MKEELCKAEGEEGRMEGKGWKGEGEIGRVEGGCRKEKGL